MREARRGGSGNVDIAGPICSDLCCHRAGKYGAGFHLGLLAKDVKIASDLAGELGVMAPVCAVTFNAFAVAREAMGYTADFTAAHKFWAGDLTKDKA